MAVERTYTIPLRREWLKSVKYKRAKKAVKAIREFLMRHMKASLENVRLGKHLNLELWKHGIKNPPSRVKVNVTKDDKGVVVAELFGAPKAEKKVAKPTKLTDAKTAIKEAQKAPDAKPAMTPEKRETPMEEKNPVAKKAPADKAPAMPEPKPTPAPKKDVGQIIR